MFKTSIFFSIALILSSCASTQPVTESEPAAPPGLPESQNTGATEPVAVAEANGVEQDDANQALANANPAMEVVEVEGIKEEKHCTVERRTGSRIPKKYCRTYTEDDRQRESSKAWINTLKRVPQHSDLGSG